MRILRNRWMMWMCLAGIVVGAIALPTYELWQIGQWISQTQISSPAPGFSSIQQSGAFATLPNGTNVPVRSPAYIIFVAITGANYGGIIGLIVGLVISLVRNRGRSAKDNS